MSVSSVRPRLDAPATRAVERSTSRTPAARSAVFARLLLGLVALTTCGCGGGDEVEELPLRGARHLFSLAPARVDVPDDVLVPGIERALRAEVTWLQIQGVPRNEWRPIRGSVDSPDGLWIHAAAPYPVVGECRIVQRAKAADPEAGRWVEAGEALVLAEGEVAIGPDGLTMHYSAAEVKAGQQPRPFPLAFPSDGEVLRRKLVWSPPTLERVADPQTLELKAQGRRIAWAPPGTELAWRLQVPEDSRMRFGLGLRPLELQPMARPDGLRLLPKGKSTQQTAGSVRFHVTVRAESDAAATTAWEEEIAGTSSGAFLDRTVDLAAWSGQWVEVTLATSLPDAEAEKRLIPFWAEPVLDSAEPDDRPDLILVVLDTLRADRLGCYGHDRPVSPFIDTLAAEGVLYEDVMSAATWTLPSHVSMLTSMYPPQHGVLAREKLSTSIQTVAESLRDSGYQTLAATEGLFLTPRFGLEQGFDHFESGSWDAETTIDRALRQLEGIRGPVFHFVHTYQVHAPYNAPERFREVLVDPYEGPLGQVIQSGDWFGDGDGISADDQRYIEQMYDAEIAYADEQLRRYCEALKARGRWDNTVVMVTSDHGESFNEHEVWGHGTSFYQEQLRIPLVIRAPRLFEAGKVVEHPVHAIDIAPTLLAAAGIERPADWMGEVLDVEWSGSPRPLFSAFLTQPWNRSVTAYREGSLKVIQYATEDDEFDPERDTLVFDLGRDPAEDVDLWADSDQQALLERIEQLWERFEAMAENESVQFEAEFLDRLKDVGYTGE